MPGHHYCVTCGGWLLPPNEDDEIVCICCGRRDYEPATLPLVSGMEARPPGYHRWKNTAGNVTSPK